MNIYICNLYRFCGACRLFYRSCFDYQKNVFISRLHNQFHFQTENFEEDKLDELEYRPHTEKRKRKQKGKGKKAWRAIDIDDI